ncbi:hypothetical protein [Pengzhenrongella sp.]|uniref:hypothetical protein n=1 Tax=Pengzhenrongella sp. TaxID=2888820 RepID=UPI002F922B5C
MDFDAGVVDVVVMSRPVPAAELDGWLRARAVAGDLPEPRPSSPSDTVPADLVVGGANDLARP